MTAVNTQITRQQSPTAVRRSFTLTELLVVIGIIVLLVGILLVALGQVRARAQRTKTEALMNGFANACAAFQAAHGRYPGVIPDDVLLNNVDGNGAPYISSTENALLHLMGGYRVMSPFDPAGGPVETDYDAYKTAATGTNSDLEFVFGSTGWKLIVDKRKIGEGPVVDGKPQEPMFTAKDSELYPVKGQFGDANGNGLPDLVDAWGQPIIYIRRVRDRGPLAGPSTGGNVPPQFLLGGVASYLGWPLDNTGSAASSGQVMPGEFGLEQVEAGNPVGSVLTSGNADQRYQTFAMIVRHPGVSSKANSEPDLLNGSSRGAIILISAGPDGIYYSAGDGEGSPATPEPDITQYYQNPQLIQQFDDVIVFSGG